MVQWHAVPVTLEPSLRRLLANAVLGALRQYCVSTCEYMLHDAHPLSTASHDPRASTWACSHIEQMQCGEEHVVEPPIL